jgi:hypothetical protein
MSSRVVRWGIKKMSLMGRAAMVAWHDLTPGSEAEHDDWHSSEHLFERVAIPGFRRGRRCRAMLAEEEYFLMYEVDDLSVLTSPAYLARLNDPTEWSRRIIPRVSNMTRTMCRVLASEGGGVGTAILTVRLAAQAATRESLVEWLADRQVRELSGRRGVVGAHLLEGDDSASGVKTDEMRLRGGDDRIADLVLLVEGYDPDALRSLLDEQLSVADLIERGAKAEGHAGLYRAGHIVTEADLARWSPEDRGGKR